jgi:hypothetical protein
MMKLEIELNEPQESIIKEMIPMYGQDEQEVVRTIILMFFHENITKIEELLYWTEE